MEGARGEADQRGKIPSFKTIKLDDLEKTLEQCQDEGKYVFLADMSGKAMVFFDYN